MVNTFKQTILKEKESVEYGYEKENLREIADCFEDKHITTIPEGQEIKNVKGTIDNSEYVDGEGVVIDMSVYDTKISNALKNSFCSISPVLITDTATGDILDVDSAYFCHDTDEVVGDPEVI